MCCQQESIDESPDGGFGGELLFIFGAIVFIGIWFWGFFKFSSLDAEMMLKGLFITVGSSSVVLLSGIAFGNETGRLLIILAVVCMAGSGLFYFYENNKLDALKKQFSISGNDTICHGSHVYVKSNNKITKIIVGNACMSCDKKIKLLSGIGKNN